MFSNLTKSTKKFSILKPGIILLGVLISLPFYVMGQTNKKLADCLQVGLMKSMFGGAEVIDLSDQFSYEQLCKAKHSTLADIIYINKDSTDPEYVHMFGSARGKLCIKSDLGTQEINSFLSKPINSPKVVALLPETQEGVQNVFSTLPEDYSNLVLKQMERVKKNLEDAKILSSSGSTKSIANTLRTFAQKNTDDFLVLIGHNEQGILRCPDNSSISISEINSLLQANDRAGIVLSCETIKYHNSVEYTSILTTERLEFDEISGALMRTRNALSSLENPSVNDFVVQFEQSLQETTKSLERKVKVVTTFVGGSMVVLYIIEVQLISNEDSKK